MRVGQARDAARQWVMESASALPGFCGAYTAGSTNWLRDDAELPTTSDCDIMVVLAEPSPASMRKKFKYHAVTLEASYLTLDQFRSPDVTLSDYHLAPSFQTATILLDPSGQLTALRADVCQEYPKRRWVRRRCADARDKLLVHLGYHREAMFWIAVTQSRCQKVLSDDGAAELPQRFSDGYRHLVEDLGVASAVDVQRRCAQIDHFLPRVWEIAEEIMAANPLIEDD